MSTLQIIGIASIFLGATLFFGGRSLTRKVVLDEVIRKVLRPDSKRPLKSKILWVLSGLMVFLGGVSTAMGGSLLLRSIL